MQNNVLKGCFFVALFVFVLCGCSSEKPEVESNSGVPYIPVTKESKVSNDADVEKNVSAMKRMQEKYGDDKDLPWKNK